MTLHPKLIEPRAEKPPIHTWSASSLKNFEECPYRLWLGRVVREPMPDFGDDLDHPLVRGTRVHKEAEDYVRGTAPLTKDLRKFAEDLTELRNDFEEGLISVEGEWGFDKNWNPTEYLGANCWALVKVDAVRIVLDDNTVRVIDYKTGKKFGKEVTHGHQMQIYATAAAARMPSSPVIQTELWYLDEGKKTVKTYPRPQIEVLRPRITARAMRMTGATHFPPKPNRNNCKFCNWGTNVGTGACPFAVTEF